MSNIKSGTVAANDLAFIDGLWADWSPKVWVDKADTRNPLHGIPPAQVLVQPPDTDMNSPDMK
jgi:hypothetical protein